MPAGTCEEIELPGDRHGETLASLEDDGYMGLARDLPEDLSEDVIAQYRPVDMMMDDGMNGMDDDGMDG